MKTITKGTWEKQTFRPYKDLKSLQHLYFTNDLQFKKVTVTVMYYFLSEVRISYVKSNYV